MATHAQALIRVIIADAQPLYRDALGRTIRQDAGLQLAAEFADGRAALAGIRRLRPDVAVLDLELPGLDGRRIVDAMARDRLETRVMLLTAGGRPGVAFDAVAAGARGCLSKRVPAEAVRDAVRRVASGEAVLCDELQTVVLREIRLRHQDEQALLSRREREILALMAQGFSTPKIARRLHLAHSTVKTYAASAYERLGVHERAQAVAEAMRRGLLD